MNIIYTYRDAALVEAADIYERWVYHTQLHALEKYLDLHEDLEMQVAFPMNVDLVEEVFDTLWKSDAIVFQNIRLKKAEARYHRILQNEQVSQQLKIFKLWKQVMWENFQAQKHNPLRALAATVKAV